jgi:hypothetical protein
MTEPAFDDWMARYRADQERRQQALTHHKATLLRALRKASIKRVTITYDGEGDSGQTESIETINFSCESVPLTEVETLVAVDGTTDSDAKPLREHLDDFLWEVLNAYHDGFENNDGGYGTLTINVAPQTVTLEHANRFMSVESSTSEL